MRQRRTGAGYSHDLVKPLVPSTDVGAGRVVVTVRSRLLESCSTVAGTAHATHTELHLQEFWSHADRFSWAPEAIFGHVARLADVSISTKAYLEDVLGDLADHRRESKAGFSSQERLFFQNAMSQRFAGTKFMSLQPGDYLRQQVPVGKRTGGLSGNRADVFGEIAWTKSEVGAKMKALCKEGDVGSADNNSVSEVTPRRAVLLPPTCEAPNPSCTMSSNLVDSRQNGEALLHSQP